PARGQLFEEPAAEIERAAQIDPKLLEVDRDSVMARPVVGVILILLVMMVRAGPHGDAIAAVVEPDRGSEAGPIAEPRQSSTKRQRFGRAVGQDARLVGGGKEFVSLVRLFLRL